jgi:transposase
MNSVAVVPLDIHKKFSKAVEMGEGGEVLGEARVSHAGRDEMEKYFRRFPAGTDVVMEATFNWPWIADVAEEAGLRPHLAHPMRVREMAKGMAKSDRKDAVFLGKLWLAGDIFPESYLAPAEVRRMRGLFRLRLMLVSMRTALKNTIHGQLHRQGILIDECSDLFGKKGLAVLEKLEMKEYERWQLDTKLCLLGDMGLYVEQMEQKIRQELRSDARAELLISLPGVGEITAYSMLAEIGEIERFHNSRALASYAGLLPLDNESAEKDFGKRTGAHCNRFLRWALIEAVSGAIRSSPRMMSLCMRVRARNKDKPQKARIAVARELIELSYLLLTRKVRYEEKRPPRPGSKETRDETRPNRASQSALCARSPQVS